MPPLRSDGGRPVVWLHIGAMKTGTTYLQQLMYANRAALGEAGLFLPGERWGSQVRAVQEVMHLDRTDRTCGASPRVPGKTLLERLPRNATVSR